MAATSSPQYPEWVPGVEIDHVNAARTHLRSIFPEASINPSSVESTLLEAFVVPLGPVALAYQYAPQAVTEHLMSLYGLYRHQGRKAVGKAKFRIDTGTAMQTIPTGTILRYHAADQSAVLEFRTTETITILTSESLEGTAHIEATETGASHNGVPIGSELETVTHMVHVESVEVSERTRAGEGAETDESFTQRAFAKLSLQSDALVYPENFEAAAITREEVGRARVVNNWDSTDSTVKTGHVTVAVTDNTGRALPEDVREDLEDWFENQALASLVIHVTDHNYTTVNIAATVEAEPGSNHAEVEAAVMAELDARLDPMSWGGRKTITGLDIAGWIGDAPGVSRVVTVPATINLPGAAPLPLPGAFTITINEATV